MTTASEQLKRNGWVGLLIGTGIVGAMDEILLHQLLAWHHFYGRLTPDEISQVRPRTQR